MGEQHATVAVDEVARRRPRYLADIAAGTDRFFEPRRNDCPWCGSDRIVVRVRTTDLLQHKPGRFVLERCVTCDHTFQNPRLNDAGLEFYYRDMYDGLGGEKMAQMFEATVKAYRARAAVIIPHHQPKQWLDVGMGHGHFCREAKTIHPDTEFDGLDISDGVQRADENGWVRTGYQGELGQWAAEFRGRYDVISMFHYLEHTVNPKEELAAAAEALPPGGYLLIELPDPECKWNKVLGRYWMPWLQPQHLNMMPLRNLRTAAVEVGLEPVEEQRAESHDSSDLVAALYLMLARFFADDDRPWQPEPPTRMRKVLCKTVWILLLPLLVTAFFLDKVLASVGSQRGLSNAYRFLAVKPKDT